MKSWRRIRIGSIIFGIVVGTAVLGYCLLGRSPLDALYMVIITISSIGFTERSDLPPIEKGFTILVIVFGMTAAAYALGGFVQLMTEGEIARVLGLRRLTKEIERLSGHIIVCGFGRIGHFVAEELHRHQQEFVLVEHSAERVAEAENLGYLVLNGDAREEDVLEAVGVKRAKTLVTALNTDADNVFITLTSRELNPKLHIIARGELPSTRKKLLQAGADRVVLPAAIGAAADRGDDHPPLDGRAAGAGDGPRRDGRGPRRAAHRPGQPDHRANGADDRSPQTLQPAGRGGEARLGRHELQPGREAPLRRRRHDHPHGPGGRYRAISSGIPALADG